VRFTDFLRVTVMLSAGVASVLAAVSIVAANANNVPNVALAGLVWWLVCGVLGFRLGRRAQTTPPIARLLAGARSTGALPDQGPGRVILNRLWPMLLLTVLSGAAGFLLPQLPAIAAGGPIVLALYWRRQDSAVAAIEDRDGAAFYVDRTSPLKPMALVRAPGFKRSVPELGGRI
jgi:hypothetical protein